MGQGISDIFYLDNPNQRDRAEQLRNDIKAHCNSYDEIKKARYLLHEQLMSSFLTLPTEMKC